MKKEMTSQNGNTILLIVAILAILFVVFFLMQKNNPAYAPSEPQSETQMQQPIESDQDLNKASKDLEMTDVNQIDVELKNIDAVETPAAQ